MAILVREPALPGVSALEVGADVRRALGKLVAWTRFEHDHLDAAATELEGHDPAGGARADDADLGVHRRPLPAASDFRTRVAGQIPAAAGEDLIADRRPPRRRGPVAGNQVGNDAQPDHLRIGGEWLGLLSSGRSTSAETVTANGLDTTGDLQVGEGLPGELIEESGSR